MYTVPGTLDAPDTGAEGRVLEEVILCSIAAHKKPRHLFPSDGGFYVVAVALSCGTTNRRL